jgi:hypothetical protein
MEGSLRELLWFVFQDRLCSCHHLLCLSPAVILNILPDFTTFTDSKRCKLDKDQILRRDSTLFMAQNAKLLGTPLENHHLLGGPMSLGRPEHRRGKLRRSLEVGYSSADCLWMLEKKRWM